MYIRIVFSPDSCYICYWRPKQRALEVLPDIDGYVCCTKGINCVCLPHLTAITESISYWDQIADHRIRTGQGIT